MDERRVAFDVYFASVVGMNLHPGTTRDAAPGRTLEQCRDIALAMLALRESAFPSENEP